jgi:hypothetical protein
VYASIIVSEFIMKENIMKWFVPVLVALILLQSGFQKKGSFDLTATGGSGGTGDVVIISG